MEEVLTLSDRKRKVEKLRRWKNKCGSGEKLKMSDTEEKERKSKVEGFMDVVADRG